MVLLFCVAPHVHPGCEFLTYMCLFYVSEPPFVPDTLRNTLHHTGSCLRKSGIRINSILCSSLKGKLNPEFLVFQASEKHLCLGWFYPWPECGTWSTRDGEQRAGALSSRDGFVCWAPDMQPGEVVWNLPTLGPGSCSCRSSWVLVTYFFVRLLIFQFFQFGPCSKNPSLGIISLL